MGNKEGKKSKKIDFDFDPEAQHELGREIGMDYRGFLRLKERLTKAKPRKRGRMY